MRAIPPAAVRGHFINFSVSQEFKLFVYSSASKSEINNRQPILYSVHIAKSASKHKKNYAFMLSMHYHCVILYISSHLAIKKPFDFLKGRNEQIICYSFAYKSCNNIQVWDKLYMFPQLHSRENNKAIIYYK